jgi:hypothetical protein
MNTFITTLFNNGENDGDIKIITNDGVFNCHSFVLKYCTDFQLDSIVENQIPIGYNRNVALVVFGYMYTPKVPEFDIGLDDIISIFKCVNDFKCKPYVTDLKQYLGGEFLKQLTVTNWITYFDMLYGKPIYFEINSALITYYTTNILCTRPTPAFLQQLKNVQNDAVYDLFVSTLTMFFDKNKKKPLDEEPEEEEVEEDITIAEEYSNEKIIELLKLNISFKDIAQLYHKDRDSVVADFVKHIRAIEKGKKVDFVIKKYNIRYVNDKTSMEKILSTRSGKFAT